MRYVIWILTCTLALSMESFSQSTAVQSPYSESGSYAPQPYSKKKDKRKADEKTSPIAVKADPGPMSIRVSVLDRNGKPVGQLTREDFKLFLDDQEHDITSIEPKSEPVNYVFMVDDSVSSTMAIKDLAAQVERVLDALVPGDRAMAITFSGTFKVVCELTDDREKCRKAIRKAVKSGESGTSLYDLIEHASKKVVPTIQHPSVIVLFTDGVDTTSRRSAEESLAAAEIAGVPVYVSYLDTLTYLEAMKKAINSNRSIFPFPISIPAQGGTTKAEYEMGRLYLNDLMKLSGGHTVRDVNAAGTAIIFSTELPEVMRSQYLLTFTLKPASLMGQRHRLNVRVNRPNVLVTARGSFITTAN